MSADAPPTRGRRIGTALMALALLLAPACSSSDKAKPKADTEAPTTDQAGTDTGGGTSGGGIDSSGDGIDRLVDTPVLSADGRFVAFTSTQDGLVPNDTNGHADVFVQERRSGEVERVSVADDGTEGDADSYLPSISADGRFVSFASSATTFTDRDTAKLSQVYLHDRSTGTTKLVSASADGKPASTAPGATPGAGQHAVSDDGRRVVWEATDPALAGDPSGLPPSVYLTEVETGAVTRLDATASGGAPDSGAYNPVVSADGSHVAFDSAATNLVAGDGNAQADVFLVDLAASKVTRVSVRDRDTEANGPSFDPSISGDGTRVSFQSSATNLADHDENKADDVFVRDVTAQTTVLVSANAKGRAAAGGSENGRLSRDGRVLAFTSIADDLVDDDANKTSDVFVARVDGGAPKRASVVDDGTEATGWSGAASLDAKGTLVAFMSDADNLPGARKRSAQAFLFDLGSGKTVQLAPPARSPHDSAGAGASGDSAGS